jgi:hypothetical protein
MQILRQLEQLILIQCFSHFVSLMRHINLLIQIITIANKYNGFK